MALFLLLFFLVKDLFWVGPIRQAPPVPKDLESDPHADRAPSSLGRVAGPERGSSGAQGHHGLTGTPPDGSELVHVAGGRGRGIRWHGLE